MKTTKLIAALAGTAALVSLAVLDGAAKASAPGGKIARRVLSDTAGGKRTEALVVLRAQANLAPAEALATKADKGRFVVDALRADRRRKAEEPVRKIGPELPVAQARAELRAAGLVAVVDHEPARQRRVALLDEELEVEVTRAERELLAGASVDAHAADARRHVW